MHIIHGIMLATFASMTFACSQAAPEPPSRDSTASAALAGGSAIATPSPGDAESCIRALKQQVTAGTLTLADYEKRALLECGLDVGTTAGGPKGDPAPGPGGEPAPATDPAYVACANAVKAEVIAGTIAFADYESTIATRCPVTARKGN